jgi:plastocyanin
MTSRWLTCFSLALAAAAEGPPAVSGRVELADSRDPAVRKQKNYSGVVVWLEPAGKAPPPRTPPVHVQMLQRDKRFVPHVLAIPVGATVEFPNLDPIFHNAFSNFSGQPFDVGLYAPGTTRAVTFRRPGIVRVFCNIHSTMNAVIAVLPTPYFGVSDASGAFHIAGVPPGDYRLQVFHERALPETLKALERRVAVGPGGLELPRVSISETGFILAPHLNKYGKHYPPLTDEKTYPGAGK